MPDPAAVRAFLEDEHVELAQRLAVFCERELAPLPAPTDDDGARQRARTLLASLAHAGFYQPILGRDLRACTLTREALAAASPLADAVFALQALGTTPLLIAGGALAGDGRSGMTEPSHAYWLNAALRGDAMAAFAMTEPGAGSDVASIATRARRDRDGWILDGQKTLISNAGIADFYVVFASTDPDRGARGISCFLVPASSPGLGFVGAQVLSEPHPLGEVTFHECRMATDALVGPEGGGLAIGLATLDRLRPTVAAAACGIAERALNEALAHATQRRQFERTLSEFQLVQDGLARMAIELAAARLLAYRAAWEADRGKDRITTEAAMAKAYATEAAQRIVDQAVQIVGGRAVLADSILDRLYRTVRALRIYEGTTEMQHLIIARQLIGKGAT